MLLRYRTCVKKERSHPLVVTKQSKRERAPIIRQNPLLQIPNPRHQWPKPFLSHIHVSAQNPRSTSTRLSPETPLNAHFKVHHRIINRIQQYPSPNRRFEVRASAEERSDSEASSNTKLIIVFSAITGVLAVANRVLYKLALVPMKEYPFFLAQVTTFGYVAIYFSILFMRYRARIVTDEMMAIPKSPFMMIGILEALGVAAGMSAGGIMSY
ncbi:CRT (chloroquine-resistance transporter)-like transporter 2 [Actinidia rufa]|uniref:CRT (Chloroquine-resistance transporter)-like transporter 2 n=1 Tax=Actinidia rufa TaxID=165716 RepID=A0A7J0GGY6_9ERIC|nr:CRT (chloroquine-resistance transporter)-like transporter 2 [Actinidia rufa]